MIALEFLQHAARWLGILFILCYAYQFLYIPVALAPKKKKTVQAPLRRYAILISARNEESVIAQLLDSISQQDYPADLIVPFVVADNCTDATARVARDAGAVVYERFNKQQVGKGYALNYLIQQIRDAWGDEYFDGYFVFDADNLLQPDYISQMNNVFGDPYQIVTSYRNSKNFGDNWISARLCSLVPAGGSLPQRSAVPSGHQLHGIRHRLSVQPRDYAAVWRLALPYSYGRY